MIKQTNTLYKAKTDDSYVICSRDTGLDADR